MPTDLRIVLPNRPGAMAHVCELIAEAEINVLGTCGDLRPGERWGFIHVVVEEGGAAKNAVEEAGYEVTGARPVELIPLVNEPGALARVLKDYSDRGINIDVVYIASGDLLVVGTEDMVGERVGVNVQQTKGS